MMRLRKHFVVSILVSMSLSYSCSEKRTDEGIDLIPIKYFDECVKYEFEILALEYDELPNTRYQKNAVSDSVSPRDNEGVILFEYSDSLFYHPVNMCHKSFALLDFFIRSNDSTYLNALENNLRRLMKESIEFDNAAYLTYGFDYRLHGHEDGWLPAPWYSGMAQGEALSVFVRTFTATGDSVYLKFAEKLFASFARLRGESTPWTVFVDDKGCYWIEEYPTDEPSKTLNGFMSAMFGVYDYYQLTGNDDAKKIFNSCLSTVKNYVPLFRRPGGPSYYGLTFQRYYSGYHNIHIQQLRILEKMTGDTFFGGWADSLYADYSLK